MAIGLSGVQLAVIIRVMTKSEDRAAGVRFADHEYDYELDDTKSYDHSS